MKIERVLTSVLIIGLVWIGLSAYQQSRYTDEYNCDEMSYECAGFFSKIGIPTEVMHGKKMEGFGLHCWVRLWGWLEFESTNLMFMQVSDEYKVERIEPI